MVSRGRKRTHMKFPVLWSGLCCYSEGWGGKCSEILATTELLYNPRVNKVFTFTFTFTISPNGMNFSCNELVNSPMEFGVKFTTSFPSSRFDWQLRNEIAKFVVNFGNFKWTSERVCQKFCEMHCKTANKSLECIIVFNALQTVLNGDFSISLMVIFINNNIHVQVPIPVSLFES